MLVSLTKYFASLQQSYYRNETQAYGFIDWAFETEQDDKEMDIHLKRGFKMMGTINNPDSEAWHNFFQQAFTSGEPTFMDTDNGHHMRAFGLNLAASDPLILFDHS